MNEACAKETTPSLLSGGVPGGESLTPKFCLPLHGYLDLGRQFSSRSSRSYGAEMEGGGSPASDRDLTLLVSLSLVVQKQPQDTRPSLHSPLPFSFHRCSGKGAFCWRFPRFSVPGPEAAALSARSWPLLSDL